LEVCMDSPGLIERSGSTNEAGHHRCDRLADQFEANFTEVI